MSGDAQRTVVDGGGVEGTWHALGLVQAGFTVDPVEADAAPTGASSAATSVSAITAPQPPPPPRPHPQS
jgi:glycine/D-amino acid oxidase-like deaminating enzyme